MEMAFHRIKLFALSTCSHCKAAEKLLKRYDDDVEIVNVDRLDKADRGAVLQEVKQHNPRITFPTTVIDGKAIVGYKADQIKKALASD
jgi:glutaredoxin-like protein NrdH